MVNMRFRDKRPLIQSKRAAFYFVLWIVFIFCTSSTVVRPLELFGLIEYFTGADSDFVMRFKLFWGVSWFTIVKGWHVLEFVILVSLCSRVLRWWFDAHSWRLVVASMVFGLLFAITDEWHQTFVPDRFGTVLDVLIDSIGICIAGVLNWPRSRSSKSEI